MSVLTENYGKSLRPACAETHLSAVLSHVNPDYHQTNKVQLTLTVDAPKQICRDLCLLLDLSDGKGWEAAEHFYIILRSPQVNVHWLWAARENQSAYFSS